MRGPWPVRIGDRVLADAQVFLADADVAPVVAPGWEPLRAAELIVQCGRPEPS